MRDINSMSRGNALAQTQYNAQLVLPDKSRAVKGLVVCYDRDLEPLDLLNSLDLGCYQPSSEVLLIVTASPHFTKKKDSKIH